jgi:triosephosphate isomerase
VRTTLIAGNWKMNKTASEAGPFVQTLIQRLPSNSTVDVVLAPPLTALETVRAILGSTSPIGLGAQNLFWEDTGAYTGEVSAPMLKDLGCRYVILGHSERRTIFAESDVHVQKKIRAALRHGLSPILCVGESLQQRESGSTDQVITQQLGGSLGGLTAQDMAAVIIAYEPVWAIGTGKAATVEQAVAVHRAIRQWLEHEWSAAVADRTRILYGGSTTPKNIEGLLLSDQIDGALVGGACLDVESFASMIEIARRIRG